MICKKTMVYSPKAMNNESKGIALTVRAVPVQCRVRTLYRDGIVVEMAVETSTKVRMAINARHLGCFGRRVVRAQTPGLNPLDIGEIYGDEVGGGKWILQVSAYVLKPPSSSLSA